MSKRHLLLSIALVIFNAVGVMAQNGGVTPLIEHHHFSNDHQYFAPAVWEDLGRNRKPNTGWTASILRMRTITARQDIQTRLTVGNRPPDYPQAIAPDGGDWSWGNRVDIGYMTEANNGWMFGLYDINASGDGMEVIRHTQINFFNVDQLAILDDPTADITSEDLLPEFIRNNPSLNYRAFDEVNSFNTTQVTSFDAMKTFRLPLLHNGGFIEPMFGLRYMKVRDLTTDDKYFRYTDGATFTFPGDTVSLQPFPGGTVTPGPVFSATPNDPLDTTSDIEQMVNDDAYWLNHVFLAQVGFRMQVPHGRWTLNNELKVFCGQNWQEFGRIIDTFSVLYDGFGEGSEVIDTHLRRNRITGNDQEFLFGTDARVEAAYHLTRDIMFNTGVQYTYFGRGIGRGNLIGLNEQDFGQLSVLFGVVYNR